MSSLLLRSIIFSNFFIMKKRRLQEPMKFEKIRDLREDNDKTQTELADYLHIKQTTYSKYELGKINIPIEAFIKLADYYNVTVDYLIGRESKKK